MDLLVGRLVFALVKKEVKSRLVEGGRLSMLGRRWLSLVWLSMLVELLVLLKVLLRRVCWLLVWVVLRRVAEEVEEEEWVDFFSVMEASSMALAAAERFMVAEGVLKEECGGVW